MERARRSQGRHATVVVVVHPVQEVPVRPVLFSLFGVDVQTYGVSKLAAALLGAYLLGKAFTRLGLPRDSAYALVMWATIWGFVGAKVYFLLEQMPDVSMHDLGGMGFTWYGGLIGGTVAALVVSRRHQLPAAHVAGAMAAPLSAAYAVGRLGCLIAGDGTYGEPTSLPWGMTFPSGVVATDVPVHPTPLYEAILAALMAVALWQYWRRADPVQVFGAYLVASGVARFLVEMLRTNEVVLLGLTQPQLWALLSAVLGASLWLRARSRTVPPTRTGATAESRTAAPVH
jgi:phosphatidylglycerol:prolipoprotein diacylglycerol transferase